MGFSANIPISESSNAVGGKGKWIPGLKTDFFLSDQFPIRLHYCLHQKLGTRLSPCLVHQHLRVVHATFQLFVAGWGYIALVLDGCSKGLVFGTRTRSKLAQVGPVIWLSFLKRYLLIGVSSKSCWLKEYIKRSWKKNLVNSISHWDFETNMP